MEDILYSNDNFKIIRNSINKNIFKIFFSNSNPILIDSLIKTRIIRGGISTDDYTLLTFKSDNIQTFQQFQEQYYKLKNFIPFHIEDAQSNRSNSPIVISNPKIDILNNNWCKRFSINTITNMVDSLTTQLKYLLQIRSYTFLGYNIENLIVIDGEKFVFLDSELLTEVSKDTNHILISFPFKKTDFFVSPELLKINEIPSYVHFKTTYFSLGCLLLHALTSDYNFYNEYLKDPNNLNNKLEKFLNFHPIRYTKLYWLIERCLVEEPENRSILFI